MENLDCLSSAELMAFWARYRQPTRADAAGLFGGKFPLYTRVAKDLANYASNRATAISCRTVGNISVAQDYERICERIYSRLPEIARW